VDKFNDTTVSLFAVLSLRRFYRTS